jgi:DNA-binding response OmpR family regulator
MTMPHTSPDSPLLIVEDDALTRAFLVEHLAADGYDPIEASTVAEALEALERSSPCLVLSDLTLPDGSGLDVVARIRSADGIVSRIDPATPVVLLTGRDGEIDRVRGLERGADDYVVKPFSYAELRLRIAGLLRRVDGRPEAGVVRVGELVVDPGRRTVVVRGVRISLTQKEYALLLALVREPTRVFAKDDLLRTVWGFRSPGVTRTIDSHACRLRRKLGHAGDHFVVNVWGVGYRLVDAAPDAVAAGAVA